jgi:hypothetical protein
MAKNPTHATVTLKGKDYTRIFNANVLSAKLCPLYNMDYLGDYTQ